MVHTGTGVTASLTDNVGPQSVSLTTSNGATNTQVAFGWMAQTASSWVVNSAISYVLIGSSAWTVEAGTIDGNTSGTFVLATANVGTTSASVIFKGTWAAATAYRDLGGSNNTVSVTFTYQGAEGGGGVALGLCWSNSAQEGDFAFINTNSTPPVIEPYEMSAGWGTGISATSSSLTLTTGYVTF